MKTTIYALLSALVLTTLPGHAQQPDLKALGEQRTVLYNSAMAKLAGDQLFQKLFAEEKALGEQAAEARKSGNSQLADILSKAHGSKHMEKRYYLRLMNPAFNVACQEYDNADPKYLGTKTAPPIEPHPAK